MFNLKSELGDLHLIIDFFVFLCYKKTLFIMIIMKKLPVSLFIFLMIYSTLSLSQEVYVVEESKKGHFTFAHDMLVDSEDGYPRHEYQTIYQTEGCLLPGNVCVSQIVTININLYDMFRDPVILFFNQRPEAEVLGINREQNKLMVRFVSFQAFVYSLGQPVIYFLEDVYMVD